MSVNLKKISTESRNPNTMDIDVVSTLEIVTKLNNEDKTVPYAVEKALPQIAAVVDKIVESFEKGGRLIYMGAGTSGRIGIIDAVECPPTFGVPYDMVTCLMAGGDKAMTQAVEGAEDSKELAIQDLQRINANPNDIVVGIAASGRTPYVIGGMEYAKSLGLTTACITTSANTVLASVVDYPIEAITGPEPLTGSTRMKSGTAQKLICNMLSTASMIKIGKVYENLMVDVQTTNEKLYARARGIVSEVTGVDSDEAGKLIDKYGSIKGAILSHLAQITDVEEVKTALEESKGNLRKALQAKGH
ncbi:MAG TPA: N-acetylmuramic acid 6-phosphate etherase [Acholeplasmataceae bacterium]|nr:N-acetylmuramic acid 6-phosphate etherase [Acholeplasmataceae bacterium]